MNDPDRSGEESGSGEALAVAILRHSDFAAQISDPKSPLVVHFWAPWCAPCIAQKLAFEQAAMMRGHLRFASCDIEAEPELMRSQAIRDLPTLAIYFAGSERARISGTMRLGAMLDWLDRQRGAGPRRSHTVA
jgi:thioredoxin 2